MAAPVLVLDSASLYYRSFHALPESMTAPDGRPHNAVRGFLGTITRLVDEHRPRQVIAAWDADWRPAWRVDLVPGYKAHRVLEESADGSTEDEPESLSPQAEAIAALLPALGVPVVGIDGFEADDVIASLAAQHEGPVIAVSGDRDLVQVVDGRTRLRLAVNGGMDKWPLLDQAGVQERFGVGAHQYVDLAVLRGDPSDGLPGVPGIGAKTAASLVTAFGDLDSILAAAGAPAPTRPLTPRTAAALTEHADALVRARTVATARTDLLLPSTPSAPDPAVADALATEWGVRTQAAALTRALGAQTADE